MNRKGLIIVSSAGTLMLLAILGATVLLRGVHEQQLTTRSRSLHGALYLAEASVDQAIHHLRGGTTTDLSSTPLGNGTYWAAVQDSTEDVSLLASQYRITGSGLQAAEQRTIEALTQLTPQSVFQFALFGSQHVDVSGDAITDSYDSSLGAYNPNTPGQNGDIGTNATTLGGVSISGSIAINGQVAVGEGVTDPSTVVSIDGGSYLITGQPPFAAQSNNLDTPTVNIPPGLSCADPLNVAGNETKTLPADAPAGACNLGGDCCFQSMSVSGGGTVTTIGRVTVYITGAFSATGNTTLGVPNDPTKLMLILTSPQQATIQGDVTGNTVLYAALYAPTGTIEIRGDAEIFGSVIAQNVDISGNAKVHYDEALQEVGPIGSYKVAILSWREP